MAAGPELSCWACRAQPVEPGLLQFAAAGSRLPRLPGPPVLEPQLSLTVCLVGLQMDTLSDSIFGSMCASVVVAFSTDSAYVCSQVRRNKNSEGSPLFPYKAQCCPLPKRIKTKESSAIHKITHMPPKRPALLTLMLGVRRMANTDINGKARSTDGDV